MGPAVASPPKVLIIGGGMSGLALAQSLSRKGIPYELFERDESAESRTQGWALSMRWIIPELLNIADPSAGPFEELSVLHGLKGWDLSDDVAFRDLTSGECLEGLGPPRTPAGDRLAHVRVNRGRFREWLLKGLQVRWGKHFTGYGLNESGKVVASFADGSQAEGDLIVGADGVQSRVRTAVYNQASLPPPVPEILPLLIICGLIDLPSSLYPTQLRLGPAFYMAVAPGLRFFVGLKSIAPDQSSAQYYWILLHNDATVGEASHWINSASPAQQLDWARERCKYMHKDFKVLLDRQTVDEMLPHFVARDMVPRVLPTGPAVLIGDAAHPMAPLRGEGACQGMLDAIKLTNHLVALSSHPPELALPPMQAISESCREFEAEMVPRGTQSVLLARAAVQDTLLKFQPNEPSKV